MAIARPWAAPLGGVLVVALLAALHLALPPLSSFPGLFSDSVIYLLSAEHLAGGGASPALSQAVFYSSVFPPAFPLVLSLVDGDPAWARVLNGVCFVLAAGLFWHWLRRAGDPWLATLITLAVYSSPMMLLAALEISSEGLFLLLVFASLLAMGARQPLPLLTVALVLLAILTRTVGIALLPALAVVMWRCRWSRSQVALGAVVLIGVIGGWEAFRRQTQLGNLSYAQDFLAGFSEPLGWWLATIGSNVGRAVDSATQYLPGWLLIIIAILAVIGAAQRLRQWRADSVFLLAYVIIILLWPYPDQMERFLLIPAPLIVGYAGLALKRLLAGREWPGLALGALVLAVQGPLLLRHVDHLRADLPPELTAYQTSRLFLQAATPEAGRAVADFLHRWTVAARSLQDTVADGDCVYATFHAFTMYEARVQVEPMRPLAEFDDCRYVMAVNATHSTTPFPNLYPATERSASLDVVWQSSDPRGKLVAALFEVKGR